MTNQEVILTELKRAYPKARSYTELWKLALAGCGAVAYNNKHSSTPFRNLLRKGLIKQITIGFYVWNP
jgi:hypothetical protein